MDVPAARHVACRTAASEGLAMSFVSPSRSWCHLAGLRAAAALALAAAGCVPDAVPDRALPGHVPPAAAGLSPRGRLDPATRLRLTLGVPLRDAAGLDALIDQLYDPASARYRQFLTPDEFAAAFAPGAADYAAVVQFARDAGLDVTRTYADRTMVEVEGAAADVEHALHTELVTYDHPREPRVFFAPRSEPQLAAAIPILHVTGLDDYAVPRSQLITRPVGPPRGGPAQEGGGFGGMFQSADLRAAYAPGVTLNGAGQSVGVYNPPHGLDVTDVQHYEDRSGIAPYVPVVKSLVDGADAPVDGFSVEVALDVEMAIAMAPKLSQVIVYQGDYMRALHQMATDNVAKQLSTSWIAPPQDANANQIYLQFAAQGQSFFAASADDGAYYPTVPQYADDPYITVVGGTDLSTTGPGGAWQSESCWQQSGGGVKSNFPIPAWQQGISMVANWGSTQFRNSPDVAMAASNVEMYQGSVLWGGGTSAAAPLWAGFTALANQQAAQVRQPPVGFVNPRLYAIGKSNLGAAAFHDITTGNNLTPWNTTPNNLHQYYAVPGYDLCTGWGTPTGAELINALAGAAIRTNVAPGAAATPDGALLLATSPAGRIYTSRVVLGQAASRWLEMEGGGRTDAAPAAAVTGNAAYVFAAVKGLDAGVYLNQGNLGAPFIGWQAMPGLLTNVAPAVMSTPDGAMLLATRQDGRIFTNRIVLGQAAQGWIEMGGNGLTPSSPSAALCGNATYVFAVVRGGDNRVWLNQGNLGGPWVGWGAMAGLATNVAPAVATTPDGVIIFATRQDGRMFSNRIVLGQAAQGWVEVGGNGTTDAAPAPALDRATPYVFTLARGIGDGRVYLNQQTLGGAWVGWQGL
jgi:hypothetical protein